VDFSVSVMVYDLAAIDEASIKWFRSPCTAPDGASRQTL